MHKKLEADLISLAHRILKIKDKSDIFTLKRLSQEVYEKLSLLAFVEEYVNHTPGIKATKEDLLEKVTAGLALKSEHNVPEVSAEPKEAEKIVHQLTEDSEGESTNANHHEALEKTSDSESTSTVSQEIEEQPFDALETLMFAEPAVNEAIEEEKIEITATEDEEAKDSSSKKSALEEELQDTISVDVMADLFENAQPKSLNDKLASSIQIGLNDRIAFVKHLFNNQQEDYNRVVSQLNTFKVEKDAMDFINTMVKPEYHWGSHDELENRFLEIVSRKFA